MTDPFIPAGNSASSASGSAFCRRKRGHSLQGTRPLGPQPEHGGSSACDVRHGVDKARNPIESFLRSGVMKQHPKVGGLVSSIIAIGISAGFRIKGKDGRLGELGLSTR